MNTTLSLTLWRSYVHGRYEEVQWPALIDRIGARDPEITPNKKQVAGYSVGRFYSNKRALINVEHVDALVLDLDNNAPSVARVEQAFPNTRALVYTTHSHTPEAPRLRVIIPYTKPVDSYGHERIWAWADARCKSVGLQLDSGSRDASHLFFLPCRRRDGEYFCEELTGEPLDAERALLDGPKETVPWKQKRECLSCNASFTPVTFSAVHCSPKCADKSATTAERKTAESAWKVKIERGDYPRSCPICRRGWRQFLHKRRNGHWQCFQVYHYDTPFGTAQTEAMRAGRDKWIYTCPECNQLEKTLRRRNPEKWPRGIPPKALRELAFAPTTVAVSCPEPPSAGNNNGGGVVLPRDRTRSGLDWDLCLRLMREGATDDEVLDELRRTSTKYLQRGRGEAYAEYTVARARAVHETHAPSMRVQKASLHRLPPRFGHAERTHVQLELMSEDGELVTAVVVVPISSDVPAASTWSACFPDINPSSLLAEWSMTLETWRTIRWKKRRFEVASRNGDVRWIRSVE